MVIIASLPIETQGAVSWAQCIGVTIAEGGQGAGGLGCLWSPFVSRFFFFKQTSYNLIQVAKMPWRYLGHKSHCRKAHLFEIYFVSKYFRQGLLDLVTVGLHATSIRALWFTSRIRRGGRPDNLVSSLSLTQCDHLPPLPLSPFGKSWLRPCNEW